MRYIALLLVGMIMLAGCLQDRAAPIDERGGRVFGRNADFDLNGNELPRYSNDNPAPMSSDQDAKYIDDGHQSYGLSAAVDPVATVDLPPVEGVKTQDPVALDSADSQLIAQQTADKAQAMKDTALAESLSPPATAMNQASQQISQTVVDTEQKIAESEAANNARRELSTITAAAATPSAPPPPPAFVWPLKGEVLKSFVSSGSEGLAIAGRSGEPIRASADGTVVYVGDKLQGYGTMVMLKHALGFVTTYGHLSDAVVAKGDTVIAGQLIGFVGKTGNVTSSQLHFSLHKDAKAVDPAKYLQK